MSTMAHPGESLARATSPMEKLRSAVNESVERLRYRFHCALEAFHREKKWRELSFEKGVALPVTESPRRVVGFAFCEMSDQVWVLQTGFNSLGKSALRVDDGVATYEPSGEPPSVLYSGDTFSLSGARYVLKLVPPETVVQKAFLVEVNP
jgi:hypothetical protein